MPSIIEDTGPIELWRPVAPEKTEMYRFKAHIASKYNIKLQDYEDLWQWSVSYPTDFWEEVWHFTGVKAHEIYSEVRKIPN